MLEWDKKEFMSDILRHYQKSHLYTRATRLPLSLNSVGRRPCTAARGETSRPCYMNFNQFFILFYFIFYEFDINIYVLLLKGRTSKHAGASDVISVTTLTR